MNWDALSAIAEILGAIGVIVTLLYLSKQIGQNTNMMKATAKQEQTAAAQNIIFQWAERPELWASLKDAGELPKEKETQIELLIRASFRGFEAHCYQHDLGLLDESEWKGIEETFKTLARLPKVQKYYMALRSQYSARLREVFDPVIEEMRIDP